MPDPMRRILDVLIDVHVRHASDQIDTKLIARRSSLPVKDLQKTPGYLEAFDCVRSGKEYLESLLTERASRPAAEQGDQEDHERRQCLYQLSRLRSDKAAHQEAARVFDQLVRRVLLPQWTSAAQRAAYPQAAEIILHWHDYFLSYTRRKCGALNREFKDWLHKYFGAKTFRRDEESRNLVALMVHEQLKDLLLDGYFDEIDLRDGQDIPQDIRESVQKSFVLVQVIHQQALVPPERGKKNWPYLEFTEFVKQADTAGPEPRLQFYVGGEHVLPPESDTTYEHEWISVIRRKKFVSCTPPISSTRDIKLDELRLWYSDRAGAIRATKQSLLDRIIQGPSPATD